MTDIEQLKKEIKIIKSGKIESGKKFIVVNMTGNTQIKDLIRKFGKNYHAGFGTHESQEKDGTYTRVFWKREKPLKSIKEINQSYWW